MEKIQEIRQGSVVLSDALSQQIETLEQQISESRRAVDICTQIKSSGTSFDNLDPTYYLDEMAKEAKPQPVREFRWTQLLHPWKRFFSRWIDEAILSALLFFILAVVFRIRPINGGIYSLLQWAIVIHLLLIPVEAVLLHYFGTTPGKYMFGMRVESVNGCNPDLQDGLRRGWAIVQYGYGFTIPFYSVWRLIKSWWDSKDRGYTDWDYESSTEVRFEYYFDTPKKLAIVGIVLAYLLTIGWTINDVFRPVHRGSDLTVAQIAQNYNDMLALSNDGVSASGRMNADGSWIVHQYGSNDFVIDLSGTPENGYSEFVFTEEDGCVRKITYEQTWTDVFLLRPMGGRVMAMTMTVASAQDWFGLIPMVTFMLDLEQQYCQPQGEVRHENLVFTWSVDAKSAYPSEKGVYYGAENSASRVTVRFEIQILDEN